MECQKEHRVAWGELLSVLASCNANNFDDAMKKFDERISFIGYARKYFLPTLAYYGKTKEEAWAERDNWEQELLAEHER
jgi:hypothetical protein